MNFEIDKCAPKPLCFVDLRLFQRSVASDWQRIPSHSPRVMPTNPQIALDRISRVTKAWETLRPTKSFGGLTLTQFKTKVQPSLDARNSIAALEHQTTAALDQRDNADKVSTETIKLVVSAVKGDPAETANGELYEALGYVRDSERASGLSRKKDTAATKS